MSVEDLKDLINHPHITKVFLDREIRALLDTAVPTVQSDRLWKDDYTGKGITIAFLDSGIYPHPDFIQPVNRIVVFKNFINKHISTPYDDNGHGTHCAGAAAGNGYCSAGKYKGPAYEATIAALKILDKMGKGKASRAIQAMEWCLLNKEKYNIKIVSISFGASASESYRNDPLCQAAEKLWKEGIVVCTAAGNDGPENKTINTPGIHPALITVGASDDKDTPAPGDDSAADFSSRGPTLDGLTKPDFLIPGTDIISARARGSFLDITTDSVVDDWYLSLSGTSMAAPICAGIAAQLLEAHPHLMPSEVKERLAASCRKITAVDANIQGHGCVDAVKAVSVQPVEISSM